MSRTIFGVLVAAAMLALPAAAQASYVFYDQPGPYDNPPRGYVYYDAEGGEANNLTISNGANGAIVFNDPGAIIKSGDSQCVISGDQHTATCTPNGPSAGIVPFVSVDLKDGNDTLTQNASIPDAVYTYGGGFTEVYSAFNGSLGAGNDTATGSNSRENFYGGTGDDTIRGGGGNDFIDDFDDNEQTQATPNPEGGNDHFFGGAGDDVLRGRSGDDELRGEGGADDLYGGLGNNTIDGGDGIDYAAFELPVRRDANNVVIPYKPDDAGVVVTLNGATATTGNGHTGQNVTILNIEDIDGTIAADKLTGDGAGNIINGSSGNDTIVGGGGNDNLIGGGDKDSINSQDGQVDRVQCGGQPDDTAAVDNIDQLIGCPEPGPGSGTTVVTVTPQGPVVIRDPADKTPAVISNMKASKKVKTSKIKKNGRYSFSFKTNEVVTGEFSLSAKVGRLASISTAGYVQLAEKRRTLKANTQTTVTLTIQKSLRRALKKGKTIRLLLNLRDAGGNITARRVTIKLT